MHGLHDSYLHMAYKMAANEPQSIVMAVFCHPNTSILQIWCLFLYILWVKKFNSDEI